MSKRVVDPLRLLAIIAVGAILIVGALAMKKVLAQNRPSIVEIDGKTFMLLTEEQASALAQRLMGQQERIQELEKKVKDGNCT